MRGRGRGNNQPKWTRGAGNNQAGRNSTRNWERAPANNTSAAAAPKSTPSSTKEAKSDERSGLQWLPSVSRSSGLEPNGDALRSFETQQEYWEFIVEKILSLEVPGRLVLKTEAERHEKQSNAMILLRKLREGFVATDRRDDFAVGVVEKSAYLSLLYNSPVNTASSFSYLIDAYQSPAAESTEAESAPKRAFNQPVIGLLQFLHTLTDEFPSQRTSHKLLQPPTKGHTCLLPHDTPERTIAHEIASALRRSNWYALERLTSPAAVDKRLKTEPWVPDDSEQVLANLPRRALVHLLEQLRAKVRGSAWPVLRSAYREVVGAPWLEQSLLFPRGESSGLDEFMRGAVERSEASVKDAPGAGDVWILRRPVAA